MPIENILIALEPNYGKLESVELLQRSRYGPDQIRSMPIESALWMEPLQLFRWQY